MKDIIEIYVNSDNSLQQTVDSLLTQNSSLSVDTHLNNFYCQCGESKAVWLDDPEFSIVVVKCKVCSDETKS